MAIVCAVFAAGRFVTEGDSMGDFIKQDVCKQWVERDKKVIAPCQHLSYFPLAVDRAKDSTVVDTDGNEFIDFLTSASSLNLGSCNEHITAGIQEQLAKCTQYTAAYTYSPATIEYAERLCSVFPGRPAEDVRIAFGNCGSDCNDAAVKFARAYTGRRKIITFINAYHGSTYGSIALSCVTTRMASKMGPFMGDIYHFPFYGSEAPDMPAEWYVKEIQEAFDTYLPAEEVAAVIIEPVQGDGGLNLANDKFMHALYDLCKKHGILFISEEVQQAFWRDGHWFGIECFDGIVPDGVIMGKSVGASLTLGAFMARKDIMESLPAPAHLFTLGGNAIACAAGCAAFDYYQTDEFQGILKRNERVMLELLEQTMADHPNTIGFIRGVGMSRGLAVVKKSEDGSMEADTTGTFKIVYRSYELGLLMISVADNILRIQPPLNITEEELRRGFAIANQAISEYEAGEISDDVLVNQAGW